MENDFDTRVKNDIPQETSSRKRWSALIIWPIFVITIIIFLISIKPFKKNESWIIDIVPKDNSIYIKSAIDTYLLNTGQYPTTLNDLLINPNLNGWNGPYLYPKQLNDQFGNPYIYIPDTKGNYKLISYGVDGLPGGKGDNADIIND